jgi:ribulose-phosphate 3-epimerase
MPLPYCTPADQAPPTYQCPCHSKDPLIAPSVLACDLSNLEAASKMVLEAGADVLHLDVMDGAFVPNISFGFPVIESLRNNIPDAYLDVHMMVAEPGKWVEAVAKAVGAAEGKPAQYTFHIEATDDPKGLIEAIRATGMKVGVGIKPNTTVSDIEEIIPLVDTVLVMTVEPGFGGQSFMGPGHATNDVLPKVFDVRTRFPEIDIEVDGGLSAKTIVEAAGAGANMIVAGSSVFKGDPVDAIQSLRAGVLKYGLGKSDDEINAVL